MPLDKLIENLKQEVNVFYLAIFSITNGLFMETHFLIALGKTGTHPIYIKY